MNSGIIYRGECSSLKPKKYYRKNQQSYLVTNPMSYNTNCVTWPSYCYDNSVNVIEVTHYVMLHRMELMLVTVNLAKKPWLGKS